MAIALTVSLLIVVVVAASMLAYMFLQRAFRPKLSELEDKTTRQLNMLSDAVKRLETEIALLRKSVPVESAGAAAPISSPTPAVVEGEAQEITPDTLVVLAAAVTAFLEKKVRIRSAKILQSPYEIVNPWAQQGRAIVQASHNLPKS